MSRPEFGCSIPRPKYATPQGGTSENYYYTDRDAFRSESSRRTDLSVNYDYGVPGRARNIHAFIQAQIVNLFNQQDMCACGAADVFGQGGAFTITRIGSSVLSPANTTALTKFDPLNAAPVQGPNWNYGANFGTPLNRQAFTTSRTFRLTFGVRF